MRSRVRIGIGAAALAALAWIPSAHAGADKSSVSSSDSAQPAVAGSSFTAHVTGDVTSVDQQSGKLVINTPDGPLTAVFPPLALQNVKEGDQVTVAIGLVATPDTSSPSASPSTAPDSSSGPSGAAGTK